MACVVVADVVEAGGVTENMVEVGVLVIGDVVAVKIVGVGVLVVVPVVDACFAASVSALLFFIL